MRTVLKHTSEQIANDFIVVNHQNLSPFMMQVSFSPAIQGAPRELPGITDLIRGNLLPPGKTRERLFFNLEICRGFSQIERIA